MSIPLLNRRHLIFGYPEQPLRDESASIAVMHSVDITAECPNANHNHHVKFILDYGMVGKHLYVNVLSFHEPTKTAMMVVYPFYYIAELESREPGDGAFKGTASRLGFDPQSNQLRELVLKNRP